MKKQYLVFVIILMFVGVSISFSQPEQKPKLVVGIVVDQMRYEFINRFMPYYGKGGFRRLIEGGSNFTFAHLTKRQKPLPDMHQFIQAQHRFIMALSVTTGTIGKIKNQLTL